MSTPNTTQRPALPLYHTIAETMATLRVSRSTVNRFVKNGALMKVSLGPGSARITTASIYALGSQSQLGS
jgi:predicted site-specific integrase-resolvase